MVLGTRRGISNKPHCTPNVVSLLSLSLRVVHFLHAVQYSALMGCGSFCSRWWQEEQRAWLQELLSEELAKCDPIAEHDYVELLKWIESDEHVARFCGQLAKIGRELTCFEYTRIKERVESKSARVTKAAVPRSSSI